jgi:hypothetical protein
LKPTGPLTKAEMLAATNAVARVMPAQFPGWVREGRTAVDTTADDPTAEATRRCLGAQQIPSTTVLSPTYVSRPLGASVAVDFFASHAAAAKDLSSARSARALTCLRRAVVGRTQTSGGTTMTGRHVSRLSPGVAGSVGFQVDGEIGSGADLKSLRMVMFAAVVGRTEVQLISVGADEALPTSTDRRAFAALIAAARQTLV